MNNTKITAKVKNIAFAKNVAIHYAQPDGVWVERPLAWQKNFLNYDLFALTDNSFITTEFVIRYTVNGETFWDNNGGSNYHVDSGRPNTVGGNVILKGGCEARFSSRRWIRLHHVLGRGGNLRQESALPKAGGHPALSRRRRELSRYQCIVQR